VVRSLIGIDKIKGVKTMEFKEIIKSLALVNLIVFSIVYVIGVFYGFDIKKRSTWIYGLYGFLSFFCVGYLYADLSFGLLAGLVMAFMLIYTGTMIFWHRQRFKEAAEPWLLKYDPKENLSLIARLIKKLSQK
jgi:hypothetical protein